jgi:hypothetical protein
MGIDIPRFVLGSVLSSIIGDDINAFGLFVSEDLPALRATRVKGKPQLLERIDWETETPELPEEIRERLMEIRPRIKQADWSDYGSYLDSYQVWCERVKRFTLARIEQTPEYREAVEYQSEAWRTLSEPWHQYLNERYET